MKFTVTQTVKVEYEIEAGSRVNAEYGTQEWIRNILSANNLKLLTATDPRAVKVKE